MKRTKRLVALALAVWFVGPSTSVSRAADALTIGLGAPLAGPDAVFGNALRLGVDQAVADMNAGGGFAGRKAKVDAEDDGGDAKKGAEVAKAFVARGVPVIVGHFSSAVSVPASAVYADAGDLDIVPTAMAPLITDRGLKTVFRVCGREDDQAAVAARFLLARHTARIAILHDRTTLGKTFADTVRKTLTAAGVRDVFYGSIEKGTRDVSAVAGRIKASNAQIVVWGGGATEAGLLVRQLRDINAKAFVMGGVAMAADEFATLAGSAAEGSLIVFPQDPRTRPAAGDLLRRLRAQDIEPEAPTYYGYAAVQVLRQAAERAGSPEDAKLAAVMHSGMIFKTVVGDFGFDEKGDRTVTDFTVYVWHKGAGGRMAFDEQAKS